MTVIQDTGAQRIFERESCSPSTRCANQVELRDVIAPTQSVDPGAESSIAVEVMNHTSSPGENSCAESFSCDTLCDDGTCVTVVVDPEWDAGDDEIDVCVCPGERTINVPLDEADDEGTFFADVWLEVGDATTEKIRREVTFMKSGANVCASSLDCGADERCIGGSCVNTKPEPPADLIIGLLITLVLLMDLADRFL